MTAKKFKRYISAKKLAVKWDMDISTVHRKLAKEGVGGIRMGSRKGDLIRFDIDEILLLEKRWRKEEDL